MGFNFRGMFNRGGVLDAASGGTPMDASQQAYQPNQGNQGALSLSGWDAIRNYKPSPAEAAQSDAFRKAMGGRPYQSDLIIGPSAQKKDQEDWYKANPISNFGGQPPQQQQPNQSGFGGGQQSGPWGSAMQGGMNPGQGYFSQNNMGMYQGTPQRPFGMGNNPMMNMMNPYQGNMYGNYGNPNQRQPFMGGGFGGGGSPWGQQQNSLQQQYGQGNTYYNQPAPNPMGWGQIGNDQTGYSR